MTAFTLATDPLVFSVPLKPASFSTGQILNADALAFHMTLSDAALTPQVNIIANHLSFHATLGAVTMTVVAHNPVIIEAIVSDSPSLTVLTSVGPLLGT